MKKIFLIAMLVAPLALADPTPQDVQKLMQRDFHARGQAGMDRVVQDGVQRVCTESGDQPPAGLAKSLEADQMKSIVYPSGSLMGHWKRGESIPQTGRALQWTGQAGDAAGCTCYKCRQK